MMRGGGKGIVLDAAHWVGAVTHDVEVSLCSYITTFGIGFGCGCGNNAATLRRLLESREKN